MIKNKFGQIRPNLIGSMNNNKKANSLISIFMKNNKKLSLISINSENNNENNKLKDFKESKENNINNNIDKKSKVNYRVQMYLIKINIIIYLKIEIIIIFFF